jgi:hypothetical protein
MPTTGPVEEIADFLVGFPPFDELSRDDLLRVAKEVTLRSYPAGRSRALSSEFFSQSAFAVSFAIRLFQSSDRDPPIFFSFAFWSSGSSATTVPRILDFFALLPTSSVLKMRHYASPRAFGKAGGLPLVFNQHYAGTME